MFIIEITFTYYETV